MQAAGLTIRPATDADTDAIFDICRRTADAGKDASALVSDPRLPGYLWAAAYAKLEPDFAFVLDDGGRAIGYVLATPDSAAFARRLDAEWWPSVRAAVAAFVPQTPLDEKILARIAEPEPAKDWLGVDYPAHLHINILPEAQGSGWGRRMIAHELTALRAHGVGGVHLGLSPDNDTAVGFYDRLGFTRMDHGRHVLFGMRLAAPTD